MSCLAPSRLISVDVMNEQTLWSSYPLLTDDGNDENDDDDDDDFKM